MLKQLLVSELQDLLHAEGQLLKALPKMAKAAHDTKLKAAFEAHHKETEGQVARLNQAFELLGACPSNARKA
jgi:ferritin-like metal-binding protein YciE